MKNPIEREKKDEGGRPVMMTVETAPVLHAYSKI